MKIDFTKINGYETMTAEEKLAAIEAMELPDPDMSGFVKKDLLDRANSEAANYKRQLREKMSEGEQAAAAQAEALEAMKGELEALRQEKAVADLTKRWMGIGYSEALAAETAKAMAAGEMDKIFKNHATFIAEREKALKAELLRQTPAPAAGNGSVGVTKDEFNAMNYTQRAQLRAENPELYKTLTE